MQLGRTLVVAVSSVLLAACTRVAQQPEPRFDVVIRGGMVYDGSGTAGRRADVGIKGDRIAEIGDLSQAPAKTLVDAAGLAVAPGFINMLSWSTDSLIADGRSQGEVRQGITTQIFGEGSSMGPLTPEMKTARHRADGRHQVRDHLDDAVGVPDDAGAARRVAERGVVPRRDDDPRARDRARGHASRRRSSWSEMRATRPARDGGGRARHRFVADLRARLLCVHRGVDRIVQGRGAVPRQVHLAHAERGQPAAGSDRRTDPRSAGRRISPRRSIT